MDVDGGEEEMARVSDVSDDEVFAPLSSSCFVGMGELTSVLGGACARSASENGVRQ